MLRQARNSLVVVCLFLVSSRTIVAQAPTIPPQPVPVAPPDQQGTLPPIPVPGDSSAVPPSVPFCAAAFAWTPAAASGFDLSGPMDSLPGGFLWVV